MTKKTSKHFNDLSKNKNPINDDERSEFHWQPIRKQRWPYPMLTTIVAVALTLLVYFITVDRQIQNSVPTIEQDVQVAFEPKLQQITQEEFAKIDLSEMPAATTIEDFQKFTLDLEITEDKDVVLKEVVETVNWKGRIDSIDGVSRFWFGSAYYQDHETDNEVVYHVEFFLNTKGLTEEQVLTAFDGAVYTVIFTGDEELLKKEFNVSEFLEIVK